VSAIAAEDGGPGEAGEEVVEGFGGGGVEGPGVARGDEVGEIAADDDGDFEVEVAAAGSAGALPDGGGRRSREDETVTTSWTESKAAAQER